MAMSHKELALRGHVMAHFSEGSVFFEHPVDRLQQLAGGGDLGGAVAFAPGDMSVVLTHEVGPVRSSGDLLDVNLKPYQIRSFKIRW
jgi:hypothetical protein